MGLKLVTPPQGLPISLEEAKAHLRVDHNDEDAAITLLLKAAIEHNDGPEGFLGRALVDQTWDLYLDEFPTSTIEIPLPPLIEVVGVFYGDSNDAEQEFSAASYVVDDASQPARIILSDAASWPTISRNANAVRVRFRAGYIDATNSPPDSPSEASAVPFDIKAGILLYLGALYAHREEVVVGQTVAKLPWGAEALLRRKRKHLGMA
jgi:uncharacterized phiE125 gp8 family phage protein